MLKIERILCPVDFSESSAKACEYAFSLAEHYQARLFLQHVVEPLTVAYPYYSFPMLSSDMYVDLDIHVAGQHRHTCRWTASERNSTDKPRSATCMSIWTRRRRSTLRSLPEAAPATECSRSW